MECGWVSKRKREDDEYYSNLANLISPNPLLLVLRYEDASSVTTAYVKWTYNFSTAIQGYSQVKLLNVKGLYNYTSNRMSMIGINFDELPRYVSTGGSGATGKSNPVGPTFCVPNQDYASSGMTLYSWEAESPEGSPSLAMGGNRTYSQLTVTLQDGVGPPLTASGTPSGYFNDMTLLFYN